MSEIVFIIRPIGLAAILDHKFTGFGAEAGITMVAVGIGVEGGSTSTPRGASWPLEFGRPVAGASLEGSYLDADNDWNALCTARGATGRMIVTERRFTNPGAEPLRQFLARVVSEELASPTRCFSARFSASNDFGIAQHGAEQRHRHAAEVSSWQAAAQTVVSMMKACSPSNRPGTSTRPSQRSSCSGSATSTVGLKVIALRPAGCTVTSRRAPTRGSPVRRRMEGFHSG